MPEALALVCDLHFHSSVGYDMPVNKNTIPPHLDLPVGSASGAFRPLSAYQSASGGIRDCETTDLVMAPSSYLHCLSGHKIGVRFHPLVGLFCPWVGAAYGSNQ